MLVCAHMLSLALLTLLVVRTTSAGNPWAFGRKEGAVKQLNDYLPSRSSAPTSTTASPHMTHAAAVNGSLHTATHHPCDPHKFWPGCVGVYVGQPKGRPRILCMVMLIRKELKQGIGITKTWGAQCDRIVFFSDFDDASIGAVDVRAEYEGTQHSLINKMSRGIRMVASLFAREYDWFVKADADSFYIIENLRHYLLDRYPSESDVAVTPHYLGERFYKDGNQGQAFNPGAGYVLNRAALQLLACSYANPAANTCTLSGTKTGGAIVKKHSAKHLISKPGSPEPCIRGPPGYDCQCEPNKKGNHEDFMAAICLKHWGVLPDDTRDEEGRDYFYAYFDAPTAYQRAPPNTSDTWFYRYSWAKTDSNDYRKRLATHPIVFHRYELSQHHEVHKAARERQAP